MLLLDDSSCAVFVFSISVVVSSIFSSFPRAKKWDCSSLMKLHLDLPENIPSMTPPLHFSNSQLRFIDFMASFSLFNSLRKSTTTFTASILVSSILVLSLVSVSIVCRKFTASFGLDSGSHRVSFSIESVSLYLSSPLLAHPLNLYLHE